MLKMHPLCALKYLHRTIESVGAGCARSGSRLGVTLSLVALFLVVGGAVAEEGAGGESPYSSAELERQAAEWESFNSKVEHELRPLFDRGFPDKDAFGLEPLKSWKWWDEGHTTAGKALRGRLVRWLKATPFMEDASDLNLWFVVQLLEGGARAGAKIDDLEAKSPNSASFAAGSGRGSERERFALWTECKLLWPALFVDPQDDTFEASVRAAVESRLRGARLYGGLTSGGTVSGEVLRIVVNRGSGLFSISVGLQKPLFDPITRLRSRAYADYRGGGYSSFGSGPPEYVRSVLADHLDSFLADYLRVNADACNGPPEASK